VTGVQTCALPISEDAVRSCERLRALMYGAVSDVLFYISVEEPNRFRFLSVNPAFLKATGLSEAAVIGRTLGEVIPASRSWCAICYFATW
jgi:PAS domain-containing protein